MSTKLLKQKNTALADRAAIEHGISREEKFHARLPAESTKGFFYHFQGDSASPFPGSSFSKTKPRGTRSNANIFRTM